MIIVMSLAMYLRTCRDQKTPPPRVGSRTDLITQTRSSHSGRGNEKIEHSYEPTSTPSSNENTKVGRNRSNKASQQQINGVALKINGPIMRHMNVIITRGITILHMLNHHSSLTGIRFNSLGILLIKTKG